VIAFLFNDGIHLWRYFYKYLVYDLDISGALMVGSIKVYSFACCISDGYKSEKEI